MSLRKSNDSVSLITSKGVPDSRMSRRETMTSNTGITKYDENAMTNDVKKTKLSTDHNQNLNFGSVIVLWIILHFHRQTRSLVFTHSHHVKRCRISFMVTAIMIIAQITCTQ